MMKKNLFPAFSVLMMLVVFLASCSKKEEYVNVIPADASVVVSFDMKSMVDKSGLTDKSNEALVQKLWGTVSSGMSSSTLEQTEKMIKNPEESGLSFKEKIFLFATPKNVGFVLKVADEAKLKDFFKVLEAEKACSSIESGDGFSWVTIEGQSLCAFNNGALLLMNSLTSGGIEELKANAGIYMAQKEEASIRQNPGFKKMESKQDDIAVYVSMAGIPEMYMSYATVGLPAGASLKDLMMLGSVNFEKGKVVGKLETFTENKELQSFMDKQAEAIIKPDGEFMEYFPATTLLFLNYSIKGEKMYELLASNPQYSEILNGKDMGIDMKKLLSSFDGDLSIGLTGLSGFGIPTLLAYAKVKDDYLMNTLAAHKQMLEMVLGATLTAKGKNAYSVKYMGMDIYFGMIDQYIYATNDSGVLGRLNEKVSDPLSKASWASEAKKSPVFFGLNVAGLMKNPLMAAFSSSGNPSMSMAFSVFSECDYIQMFQVSEKVGEVDIVLKNQDENVLKQLVSGIGAAVAE